MYPPVTSCLDHDVLPRGLKWGQEYRGAKDGRGDLMGFRLYLDRLRSDQVNSFAKNCRDFEHTSIELHNKFILKTQVDFDPWADELEEEPGYIQDSRAVTASRVLLECAYGWQWFLGDRVVRQSLGMDRPVTPGPLPPRASFTGQYTREEIERFTRPMTDLEGLLRYHIPYTTYQRMYLADILGVEEYHASKADAKVAKKARTAQRESETAGETQPKKRAGRPHMAQPRARRARIDQSYHGCFA